MDALENPPLNFTDPARDGDTASIGECRDRAKAMVAVKYLEAIRRAEQDYRAWKLAFFFNVGQAALPPRPGIIREFVKVAQLKMVRREHLLYALLSLWMELFQAEGKLPPLPGELTDILEVEAAKVMGPLAKQWGLRGSERPSHNLNHGRYPKIKNLLRHYWKTILGALSVRHRSV